MDDENRKNFAEKRFPFIIGKPGVTIGAGVELPNESLPEVPVQLKDCQFLLYVGRITESKGCSELFDFFSRLKTEINGGLKLVLVGKSSMVLPEDENIIELGFVSDPMKFALMKDALGLVNFSKYESLSMVVLESMLMGTPVLVNGKCAVLKEHCLLSKCGFSFLNYEEFKNHVLFLMEHPEEYTQMRENGQKYINESYRWDSIVDRIEEFISNNSNTAN